MNLFTIGRASGGSSGSGGATTLTGDVTGTGTGTVPTTVTQVTGKITKYNGVNTAGIGVAPVVSAGRVTAQVAANASIATFTLGASDGSFQINSNVLVTASVTHAFTVTCSYTDEGNTARTVTLSYSQLSGVFATSIANAAGTVPYEGVPLTIRCKASTSITVASTGTFTSVTYNAEATILQLT